MWTRRTRLGQPENVLITPRTVAGPIKDEKTKKRQKRTLKRYPGVMWGVLDFDLVNLTFIIYLFVGDLIINSFQLIFLQPRNRRHHRTCIGRYRY